MSDITSGYDLSETGIYVKSGAHTQLRERIAELEFAEEEREWIAVSNGNNIFEFSRTFLGTVTRLARLLFLKNPLISRGVKIKADYVFGRGVNISAKDDDINDVIQKFLEDKQNQTELTAQQARLQKEIELQTDGNIFFVLVPHSKTGHIRVHSIPADEITDIITDPANRKAAWYYKREWYEVVTDLNTGITKEEKRTAYYRDWRNKPDQERQTIGGNPVDNTGFVYHIKVGGFSDWKFGVSELYAPSAWAKAYNFFLENWSKIVAAYATFAFKVTTTGGKQGVTAAVNKLGTSVTASSPIERNPSPAKGSNIVMQDGNDIQPVRTAGATTSAEDGRYLLLMVAAGVGLPETFFGNVSVGSLATATSLDRPTELMLTNRQTLWADIYNDIIQFVLYYAIKAIEGPLRAIADIEINEYGEEYVVYDESIDSHVDIDFPSITTHSLTEHMTALTQAAPFIPDAKTMARMVLTALGENDIDTLIERLYPENAAPPADQGEVDPATAALTQAAQDMKTAIEALREVFNAGRVPARIAA